MFGACAPLEAILDPESVPYIRPRADIPEHSSANYDPECTGQGSGEAHSVEMYRRHRDEGCCDEQRGKNSHEDLTG